MRAVAAANAECAFDDAQAIGFYGAIQLLRKGESPFRFETRHRGVSCAR
ncbi:hypothetical protein APY04_0641 [Hyphomicrobium sulfonivorans]|uniref:Uncharacterized protein n=1 Tax=Hyphomicrobium sulfonivorans TaxID=121290 RepID=A0A120CXH4_HYPSL|nr:hypothetical protein APY04_0641 [Hyphomicrobium sulfonivorans]